MSDTQPSSNNNTQLPPALFMDIQSSSTDSMDLSPTHLAALKAKSSNPKLSSSDNSLPIDSESDYKMGTPQDSDDDDPRVHRRISTTPRRKYPIGPRYGASPCRALRRDSFGCSESQFTSDQIASTSDGRRSRRASPAKTNRSVHPYSRFNYGVTLTRKSSEDDLRAAFRAGPDRRYIVDNNDASDGATSGHSKDEESPRDFVMRIVRGRSRDVSFDEQHRRASNSVGRP